MDEHEYVLAVNAVLAEYTDEATVQLRHALDALPAKTKEVTIDVMVDQGEEGFLTVRVGVNGPDLYVLNKALKPFASLFDTVMTKDGFSPDLPLMSGDEFEVGDVLTDCGAQWARELWAKANHAARGLPVTITSPEGYGTCLPISLQRGSPYE